jgi:SAM-dependent methyltransferase
MVRSQYNRRLEQRRKPLKMDVYRRPTEPRDDLVCRHLQQMKRARHYQRWVFSLLAPYIGSRVLEIGCGVGALTEALLDRADLVVGVEPNGACIAPLLSSVGTNPRFVLNARAIAECDLHQLLRQSFDTVVCVNRLEKIEDDANALRTYGSLVAEQAGRVVVLVPAVPAAYGPFDAALGSCRRYTRRSLADVLERAGLAPRVMQYSNLVGLLGWMYNARVSRAAELGDREIRMFDTWVAPWAAPVERLLSPPVGLSLLAVADGGPMARAPVPMLPQPVAAEG